jgi:hypothetical protein
MFTIYVRPLDVIKEDLKLYLKPHQQKITTLSHSLTEHSSFFHSQIQNTLDNHCSEHTKEELFHNIEKNKQQFWNHDTG